MNIYHRTLDALLLSSLRLRAGRGLPGPRLAEPDPCTAAGAYGSFTLPIRLLLALHYVQRKDEFLTRHPPRSQVDEQCFAERFMAQLESRVGGARRWLRPALLLPLRSLVPVTFLVLLVSALVAGAIWRTRMQTQRRQEERTLVQHLLVFSEQLHRLERYRQNERFYGAMDALTPLMRGGDKVKGELAAKLAKQEARRKKLDPEAEKRELLQGFAKYPTVQKQMAQALAQVADDKAATDIIIERFAELNRSFATMSLPYYVVPTVLGGQCDSFLSIPNRMTALQVHTELQKAIAISPILQFLVPPEVMTLTSRKICRSTLILPYRVVDRLVYRGESGEYPVYGLRRLAEFPWRETTLGLTYHKGEGSQLHLDRIESYVIESILPSLAPGGRSLMFPWMRGGTPIEDEAAAAVSKSLRLLYGDRIALLQPYAKDLAQSEQLFEMARLHQSLMGLGHRGQMIGETSVSNLNLDVLSNLDAKLLADDEDEDAARPSEHSATVKTSDKAAAEPGQKAPAGQLLREAEARANALRANPPAELLRLIERLTDAVAQHEVRHQISDQAGEQDPCRRDPRWRGLRWPTPRPPLGTAVHDIEGVCDEVAAYLTELSAGVQIRHIVLTQLASFALNRLGEGAREPVAAEIILAALVDRCAPDAPLVSARATATSPATRLRLFDGPLSVVAAYRRLVPKSDDELGRCTALAHGDLFGQPMPRLSKR